MQIWKYQSKAGHSYKLISGQQALGQNTLRQQRHAQCVSVNEKSAEPQLYVLKRQISHKEPWYYLRVAKGLQVLMHLEETASELLKAQFGDIKSQVQQLNHKCTRIWLNPNYNLITSIFNLKTFKKLGWDLSYDYYKVFKQLDFTFRRC